MKQIDAADEDIAKCAGFDRTNISHLRRGRRLAGPTGKTTQRLIGGICLFARQNDRLDALCALLGVMPDTPSEALKASLTSWLFSEMNAVAEPSSARKKPPLKSSSFGERLETAMELAALSNIRLSRLIHTDASLISRYRKGVRTPHSNPELSGRLCGVLFEQIRKNGKTDALSGYVGVPPAELDTEDLYVWLFEKKEYPEHNIKLAESLLFTFDSYQAESGTALPAPDEVLRSIDLTDRETVYYGQSGIRCAVLRFLAEVLRTGASELLLYSDEDQAWLTGDPSFRLRWASLMDALVRNGTRIRIIHSINRDLSEMHHAITSWLPLYMSGMIDSRYSKRNPDPRFSHTLFLCPGTACIEASHVRGNEANGIYHYYTEWQPLKTCLDAFGLLLENSRHLVSPASSGYGSDSAEVFAVQNTLSIATMPEALVKELDDPVLRKEWQVSRRLFLDHLNSGIIHECIPLATEEDLLAGNVPIETVDGMGPKYYTPAQYSLHLRGILDLLASCRNYRFCPIPASPFPHMKLLLSDTESRITHMAGRSISFSFRHYLVCGAFYDYARKLMETGKTNRGALCRRLQGMLMETGETDRSALSRRPHGML